MRLKAKLVGLEKRMHVTDLGRNCPLCRTRAAEIITLVDEGQEEPPCTAPPCPLCGKGPMRIVIDMTEGSACLPEGQLLLMEPTR